MTRSSPAVQGYLASPSARPETDYGYRVRELIGYPPRATVVFGKIDMIREAEGDPAACGAESSRIDIAGEPLRQPLFTPSERRAELSPIDGSTFREGPVEAETNTALRSRLCARR